MRSAAGDRPRVNSCTLTHRARFFPQPFRTGLGVVTDGPVRFVRHPTYVGVVLEVISLPLIYAAWITATAAALGYCYALSRRVPAEEKVLMANPEYRAAMGHKPRFLPGLF